MTEREAIVERERRWLLPAGIASVAGVALILATFGESAAAVRTTAGLAEKRRISRLLGVPGSSDDTQKRVRALLTGFLLFHLAGDKTYKEFADPEAELPHTSQPDRDAAPVTAEDRIVALFR